MINLQVAVGMMFGSVILAIFNIACMIAYFNYLESLLMRFETKEYTVQATNDMIVDSGKNVYEFTKKGLYTVEILKNELYIGCKDEKVEISLIDFTNNFQIIK